MILSHPLLGAPAQIVTDSLKAHKLHLVNCGVASRLHTPLTGMRAPDTFGPCRGAGVWGPLTALRGASKRSRAKGDGNKGWCGKYSNP